MTAQTNPTSASWPLTLNINVDEQTLKDILTTCVEGGSSYWLTCQRVKRDKQRNVVAIIGCEDETGEMGENENKWGDASLVTVHIGMQRILDGSVKVGDYIRKAVFELAVDKDSTSWDAETADCILQAGLLNDITFG